jgi:hypothetical protein
MTNYPIFITIYLKKKMTKVSMKVDSNRILDERGK